MKKVLILEDEVSIRSFVVINLKRAGYEAIEAGTGREALERLKENPDTGVAILDIMLPDIDGFEVCRSIRATNKAIGIIMLTARTQEMDKVTGLMTGADDYVTKPFSPAELTARIDALYRRIEVHRLRYLCQGLPDGGPRDPRELISDIRSYQLIQNPKKTAVPFSGHGSFSCFRPEIWLRIRDRYDMITKEHRNIDMEVMNHYGRNQKDPGTC